MSTDLNGMIANRAYAIWEAEGYPQGCALKHWLQAEEDELRGTPHRAATLHVDARRKIATSQAELSRTR